MHLSPQQLETAGDSTCVSKDPMLRRHTAHTRHDRSKHLKQTVQTNTFSCQWCRQSI